VNLFVDSYNLGSTVMTNVQTSNTGILPSNFLVGGSGTTRAGNNAPQSSWNIIVTGGRFTLTNFWCYNYCSTAVCADRNIMASWSNLHVYHDSAITFSNNPSGALWFERPYRGVMSGAHVNIIARDSRETAIDSSAIQLFIGTGGKVYLDNVTVQTTTLAYVSKALRCSGSASGELYISNSSIDGFGSVQTAAFANGSGLMLNLFAVNSRFTNGPVNIFDFQNTKIVGCDFSGAVQIGCSALNVPTGDVNISSSKLGGTLTLQGISGNVLLTNNSLVGMNVNAQAGSIIPRFMLSGGYSTGVILFASGVNGATVTGIETERRIEFQNVKQYTVSGCTVKTASSESCLWANAQVSGFTVRSVFANNSIWIKTGTGGAGYTTFSANNLGGTYLDNNNDKQTISWI